MQRFFKVYDLKFFCFQILICCICLAKFNVSFVYLCSFIISCSDSLSLSFFNIFYSQKKATKTYFKLNETKFTIFLETSS